MIYSSIDDLVKTPTPQGIPVVIPTFNNLSYLKLMINQLEEYGITNIIVVDNFSKFNKMHDYLIELSKKYTVVAKFTNDGPREFYTNVKFNYWLPQKFIVTDPDIGFNPKLPKDFVQKLVDISEEYKLYRVGFALDIVMDGIESNIHKIPFSNSGLNMFQWEDQFWEEIIGMMEDSSLIYRAPIDTTFCLVNKAYAKDHTDPMQIANICARVAGNFTAQHYGWYKKPPVSKEELEYYYSVLPPQWSFTSNALKRQMGL